MLPVTSMDPPTSASPVTVSVLNVDTPLEDRTDSEPILILLLSPSITILEEPNVAIPVIVASPETDNPPPTVNLCVGFVLPIPRLPALVSVISASCAGFNPPALVANSKLSVPPLGFTLNLSLPLEAKSLAPS